MKSRTRVAKVSQSIQDNLFELATLTSAGAQGAAEQLHRVAVRACGSLLFLCESNREALRTIAREEFAWPLLFEPSKNGQRGAALYCKYLEVGSNTGINIGSGKSYSRVAPANQVACDLYELAKSLRQAAVRNWSISDGINLATCGVGWFSYPRPVFDKDQASRIKVLEAWGQTGVGSKLPALSKGTATKWAAATSELVKLVYGENFEEHGKLQVLRQSVLLRKDASKKVPGRGVVRADMLKAVKQAWKSIAAVA